jgi:outer membrane protein
MPYYDDMKLSIKLVLYLLLAMLSMPIYAIDVEPTDVPDGLPDHIVGDIGLGVYSSNMSIGAIGNQTYPLPYAFFDYERFFARIDTFGIKTAKIGYGYLEVAGQVNLDNYNRKSTINGNTYNKQDPIPVGIGTFQDTPIGGFFIHAYQDVDRSGGQLYEFSYFAEIETIHKIKLYPEIAAERYSSNYANYYYGVSAAAARTLGYSQYSVAATNNYTAGLMLEIPVIDSWYFTIFGRRKFLGGNISNSPIMARSYQDSILGSIVYRFE